MMLNIVDSCIHSLNETTSVDESMSCFFLPLIMNINIIIL